MKSSELLNRDALSAPLSFFQTVFALSLFLFLIPGLACAQECNVAGGTVATTSPTSNICLNEDGSHTVELTVSGNVGIGRFGLVQAGTGNVVAVNTTGIFEMINYPPGNYQAGHVSVEDLSTFAGVTKVNQLMGCYDISNVILISSYWVEGGTITALGPTVINGGTLEFAVSEASGLNLRWVLLNQQVTNILAVQTEGIFDFDPYPDGTYRVVHGAFGPGINFNEIEPLNLQGCIDASNMVTVLKDSGSGLGPGEVYNPITGRIWMDRNLGAIQVATSPTDTAAYGDLYQWGRGTDGHQIRTSPTTTTLSNTDQPGNGSFILIPTGTIGDWRSPQNDNLWQGVNGINNPCPNGFKVPSEADWLAERQSWFINTTAGAFDAPLKVTSVGYRFRSSGELVSAGSYGYYWSSTLSGSNARYLFLVSFVTFMSSSPRASGFAVRCIKD